MVRFVDNADEALGGPNATWNKAASGRANFDSDGIHLYMSVTNEGTVDADQTPVIKDLHPYNMGGTKQNLVYVQYFTGADGSGNALGEPVLYTLNLQWTNK